MFGAASRHGLGFATAIVSCLGCMCPVFASGCARGLPVCAAVNAEYVMVERTSAPVEGAAPGAEVTEAPSYKAIHGAFRTVVLRLPDICYQPGAPGDRCGAPLQALETALTAAGYQVLSSTALVGVEHKLSVPVHVAAQQVGADVVIVVSETYLGRPAEVGDAEARYRYVVSDPRGTRSRPAELFQRDRDWLKKFVRDRIGRADAPLQARLSATILLAKAAGPPLPAAPGETIWSYSWRVLEGGDTVTDRRGLRFLFGGIPVRDYASAFPEGPAIDMSDPNRHYWWPMIPVTAEPAAGPGDRAASEERVARTVDATADDEAVLYRKVAEDFVQRFKGG